MKRVYKQATVAAVPGGWEVRLDGRSLRTPAKAPLVLAREVLARAIADEWQSQGDEVRPQSMPMMQMAATTIDRTGTRRAEIIDGVAAYAQTDLMCYRTEFPAELAARQARVWQPLLDWAALRFDATLLVHTGLMPKPQPPGACRALRSALEELDDWALTAVQVATSACGSLILALALAEGRIGAAEAFEASQLDETYQIEHWGEDSETTRSRAGLRADIADARRFLDLVRG